MSKPFRIGSAVSLVVLSSMMVGCAAPQGRLNASTNLGGKANSDLGLATRALAALNSNNVPLAIELSERAVARTPDDAGYRALLGNSYFAGGRFWSAEAAYKDSLTISSNQPQLVLKLALVQIALGKTGEALAFLEAGRSFLDAADYGLALALAGHAPEAVSVLQTAARERGADARVRQNLALAFAFAGDWTNARSVAGQDVPANQLDARIQQWMQLTKPGKPSDQVAALLGVTPAAADQGQPIRLALRKAETQVAQAHAAPIAAPAPSPAVLPPVAAAPEYRPQLVQAPAPAPQPQFIQAVATPAAELPPVPAVAPAPPPPNPQRTPAIAQNSSPAPLTLSTIAAAAPEASAALRAFVMKKFAASAKPAKSAKPSRRVAHAAPRPQLRSANSGAVMQLGAYRSPQYLDAAWKQLTQRYPALRAHLPMHARFDSANGTYWRLSIAGFANQREALARCELMKSRGGKCFVRSFAGDAPVQYASR